MSARQKLIDHLADLEKAREEARAEGNWDRVDFLGLCIDDTRDDIKSRELIEAIKAKPGYQVFPGSNGGSVIIARTSKSSVGQQSVWLGRSSTIANLERILAA